MYCFKKGILIGWSLGFLGLFVLTNAVARGYCSGSVKTKGKNGTYYYVSQCPAGAFLSDPRHIFQINAAKTRISSPSYSLHTGKNPSARYAYQYHCVDGTWKISQKDLPTSGYSGSLKKSIHVYTCTASTSS